MSNRDVPTFQKGRHILEKIVRKHKQFKNITRVVDATEQIRIEVSKQDCLRGKSLDGTSCAFARAAAREWDGAIIGRNNAYFMKLNTAYRFITPLAARREIEAFDKTRKAFEPGPYYFNPPPPSSRLGLHPRSMRTKEEGKNGKQTRVILERHRSQGLRQL